jgi:hypothetical protein
MSADPFKFNDVDGKRKSNAAASIFWERDETIDPDDKPIHLWESFRTVATYVGRPITKNIFAEQCLMAAIYWGAELYPEIDVPIIWDYTIEAGYYGYLKFGYDINGRRKKTPGYSARGSQQHMMMETHDYIELHCERIRHIEVLEEYRKIKSIKDLTNRDLFVAVAGSLMGSKYKATVIKKATRADVSSYFPSKHY